MSIKTDQINLQIIIKADSARAEIRKLEDEARILQNGLKDLKKGSDEYVAQSAKLSEVKDRISEIRKTIDLTGMTMRELQKESKNLSMQLNNMTPGSDKYKDFKTQLDSVNSRIKELKGTASDTQNSLNKTATGIGGFINSAKSGDLVGMIPMLGKFAGVIGLVAGGLSFAKDVMESTRATSKEFKADIEGLNTAWTYLLKSIAGGDLSFKGMIDAFNAGREYKLTLGEILKQQQSLTVEEAKNFNKKQELLEKQRNTNLSKAERKQAGDEILKITEEEEAKKQKIADESYNNQMKRITALTGMSKTSYESFMESYNNKDFQAINASTKAYMKHKSDLESLLNSASTVSGQFGTTNMKAALQYQKQLDDLEKNTSGSVKNLASFYHKYNKTTSDEIGSLVEVQVNAIKVHGEAIQETQRIRRTNHTLEKQMTDDEIKKHQEAAKAAQKILDDQKDKRDKINADGNIQMEVETAAYNKRLKDKGLFEKESTDLTAEQLKERERLEDEYYANLSKIAVENENKRFSTTKKDAGVDGDPTKFKGEKLKAYELIVQQHEINLTNISDSENKKRIDSEKKTDADIISSMLLAEQSELKSIESVKQFKTHALKEDYINQANGITSEVIYQKKLAQLDIDSLNERLIAETKHRDLLKAMNLPKTKENIKAMEAAEAAVAATQSQIDDIKIKGVEKFEKDQTKIKSKYSKDSLAEQYRIEKAAIDAKYLNEKNSETAHQKELFQLKIKYAVKYAQEAEQVANAAGSFISALDQAQTDSLEAEKQKQLTIAGTNADARAKVEAEFAQKELDLKKQQADADMAIKVAQALAAGALGVANIWAVDGINPILAGILTGIEVATVGMQISSIIAQRNAIKNTSLGYYTGGYTTGATDDSKPVGTVHANEFVTNAKGVRNPSVRKFLDVFNAAQMNGTIHLLNTTQILEKVRAQTPTGYQAGGYVQTNNGSVGSVGSEVAMAIISENAKQMRRLNDHLDNGIHAINTIAGDTGLYKKTQDYEKMLKNVSRQT